MKVRIIYKFIIYYDLDMDYFKELVCNNTCFIIEFSKGKGVYKYVNG